MLVIPLSQHMGKPAVPVVRQGEEVLRGQCIAKADGFLSVPQHAPATGIVRRLGAGAEYQRPDGARDLPEAASGLLPGNSSKASPAIVATASADEIVAAIQSAGVVGLGGAAFPTHVKLRPPDGKSIDTLLINGVECEPYLTTDHRVMLEQTADVHQGRPLPSQGHRRRAGRHRCRSQQARRRRRAARRGACRSPGDRRSLRSEVSRQGAEKMLITVLLGREVPSGGLPVELGVVVVNVATLPRSAACCPTAAASRSAS